MPPPTTNIHKYGTIQLLSEMNINGKRAGELEKKRREKTRMEEMCKWQRRKKLRAQARAENYTVAIVLLLSIHTHTHTHFEYNEIKLWHGSWFENVKLMKTFGQWVATCFTRKNFHVRFTSFFHTHKHTGTLYALPFALWKKKFLEIFYYFF